MQSAGPPCVRLSWGGDRLCLCVSLPCWYCPQGFTDVLRKKNINVLSAHRGGNGIVQALVVPLDVPASARREGNTCIYQTSRPWGVCSCYKKCVFQKHTALLVGFKQDRQSLTKAASHVCIKRAAVLCIAVEYVTGTHLITFSGGCCCCCYCCNEYSMASVCDAHPGPTFFPTAVRCQKQACLSDVHACPQAQASHHE